jgi:hypothetical protein
VGLELVLSLTSSHSGRLFCNYKLHDAMNF